MTSPMSAMGILLSPSAPNARFGIPNAVSKSYKWILSDFIKQLGIWRLVPIVSGCRAVSLIHYGVNLRRLIKRGYRTFRSAGVLNM